MFSYGELLKGEGLGWMQQVDTLIIGAGISGLTYALETREEFLIVEKEKEAGGLCRTTYQDGFVWDYAGHFFHFAHEGIRQRFKKEIASDDIVECQKKTTIYYHGHMIDYPFQMNIHELPKDEFVDCLYDLFEKKEKKQYRNFEDMLYGKFGKSITDKFLKPYNEKLYACHLNDLDQDAMGRFFPYAEPLDIIRNMKKRENVSYNNTFLYPKRGAAYLIEILQKKVDSSKILLNSMVRNLYPEEKIAVINDEKIKYKKLISTIPLNQFLGLMPIEYSKGVDQMLSANKVLVFNIGFDREPIDKEIHWIYYPEENVNFYRVGFYNNIIGSSKLSIYVEIGFNADVNIDIEREYMKTMEGLKKVGIVTEHIVVSYQYLIIDPAYVHITGKSETYVENVCRKLRDLGIYTTGRYGR